MIFRIAKEEDSLKIAKIHKEEIKKGFLSSFNVNLLTTIYSALIKSKNGVCVVVQSENNEIVGFVAGAVNLEKFYFYFLYSHSFKALPFLLKKIFDLRTIKKILEIFLYPKKEKELTKAELLAIAVKNNFQGKGIAVQLLEKFVVEMKKAGASDFKAVVGEELLPAISFYEKNNFKLQKKISFHGKTSRIYIYCIK